MWRTAVSAGAPRRSAGEGTLPYELPGDRFLAALAAAAPETRALLDVPAPAPELCRPAAGADTAQPSAAMDLDAPAPEPGAAAPREPADAAAAARASPGAPGAAAAAPHAESGVARGAAPPPAAERARAGGQGPARELSAGPGGAAGALAQLLLCEPAPTLRAAAAAVIAAELRPEAAAGAAARTPERPPVGTPGIRSESAGAGGDREAAPGPALARRAAELVGACAAALHALAAAGGGGAGAGGPWEEAAGGAEVHEGAPGRGGGPEGSLGAGGDGGGVALRVRAAVAAVLAVDPDLGLPPSQARRRLNYRLSCIGTHPL